MMMMKTCDWMCDMDHAETTRDALSAAGTGRALNYKSGFCCRRLSASEAATATERPAPLVSPSHPHHESGICSGAGHADRHSLATSIASASAADRRAA
jgi:hypothetical protein